MKRLLAVLAGLLAVVALPSPGAVAATTERASVDNTGAEGNGSSVAPALAANGRFVSFYSGADNLVPGDDGQWDDVFVRDLMNGTTSRISVDAAGGSPNGPSFESAVSATGRFVAFRSYASDLVPGDGGGPDIFVADRDTDVDGVFDEPGATAVDLASPDLAGGQQDGTAERPDISANGRFVAFASNASDLVSGDANGAMDIFVRDRTLQTTVRVSVDTAGADANAPSYSPKISAGGRFVVFDSSASDLVSADANGVSDVFVRDRDPGGNGVFDESDATTIRISVDSLGGDANFYSVNADVSADGRFVAFESMATDLTPSDLGNPVDVFVRDRDTDADGVFDEPGAAATRVVSLDNSGSPADGYSFFPSISPDGRYAAFISAAADLVPDDTNAALDTFVRDLAGGYTVRASVRSDGSQMSGFSSIGPYAIPVANGGVSAFETSVSNVVSDDYNGASDVFVHRADGDGDGVLEPRDNCPSVASPDLTDGDGDGLGDVCDPDDDDDGSADGNDGCPTVAEDSDGFEDGDGCPDTDNDLDGICDPGLSSVSCGGSDSGANCFDPAYTLTCPGHDCRNTAEDIDAFKDSDGCPDPDNDNDGFPDPSDGCPGVDSQTGADGMLGSPQDLNHNGVKDPVEATLTTDDVVKTFEDRDGVLDTDGCHDSPGEDFDADGFTDDAEALFIGTNAGYPCGEAGWPADLFGGPLSANKLTIQDITSFVAPVRRLDQSPGDANFSSRWDLLPGRGILAKFINIQDITALVPSNLSATARPPMFGGTPAFGQTCPYPP